MDEWRKVECRGYHDEPVFEIHTGVDTVIAEATTEEYADRILADHKAAEELERAQSYVGLSGDMEYISFRDAVQRMTAAEAQLAAAEASREDFRLAYIAEAEARQVLIAPVDGCLHTPICTKVAEHLALEQLAAAREALRKFGRHSFDCILNRRNDIGDECDCGLDALLSRITQKAEGETNVS